MLAKIAQCAARISHVRARSLLIACGLLIGLMLATGTALLALRMRDASLVDARRNLSSISLILSLEIDRSLQAFDPGHLGHH